MMTNEELEKYYTYEGQGVNRNGTAWIELLLHIAQRLNDITDLLEEQR